MSLVKFHVGAVQETGLAIYIFDVAHEDEETGENPFPGALDGSTLTVNAERCGIAAEMLQDASNSADDDGDREVSAAIFSLMVRVRRASLKVAA